MTVYSGPLQIKRKDDLHAIVLDLSLSSQLPQNRPYTKSDLVEMIRHELKTNPAARSDPRFEGLWSSMRESKAFGRANSTESEGSGSGSGVAVVVESAKKAVQQVVEGVQEAISGEGEEREESTYRQAILNNHILDTLLHGDSSSPTKDLAVVPATRSLRKRASQSLRRGSVSLHHAAEEAVGFVESVQEKASHAWVVVMGILVAELAWIVYEAIPWADKHTGPLHWLHRAHPTRSLSFRLPVLSVLYHPTFLSALSLWALTTYLLPLALSTLISFPAHSHAHTQSRRRHSHSKKRSIAPPNALIFTLTRLSIALLRGFILRPHSPPSNAIRNLTHILSEVAQGVGSHGLAGGRWSFEGAVEGVWGVVGVGMGVGCVVCLYAGEQ
ncbi:hypothetical protein NBRC10513v2_007001 [Rhodotorula toruloides]|uniref:Uncharacterized protein n=1 Tax=Rhodotorula toruloides TaxID=5286 RepID=A0A0K3CT86_RHOTO|nr:hypothetical protein AAT19DRAFT_10584 [Rhodotorula toruloides]